MVPAWYCIIALLLGAGAATAIAYVLLYRRKENPRFDELLRASVEAAREKTRHEAQEQVLENIRPEIQYFVTTEKHFFVKRTRLVIRERLVYKHLPLMGWMEHSHLVDEHMDTAQLEEFAKAAARLVETGPNGGGIVKRA